MRLQEPASWNLPAAVPEPLESAVCSLFHMTALQMLDDSPPAPSLLCTGPVSPASSSIPWVTISRPSARGDPLPSHTVLCLSSSTKAGPGLHQVAQSRAET